MRWLAARIGSEARPIRLYRQSSHLVCDSGGHDTEFPDKGQLFDTVLDWLDDPAQSANDRTAGALRLPSDLTELQM